MTGRLMVRGAGALALVASLGCGTGGKDGGDTAAVGGSDGLAPGSDAGADVPPTIDARMGPDASGGGRDVAAGDRSQLPERSPDGRVPECIWRLLRECCGSPLDRCTMDIRDGGVSSVCMPTGETQVYTSRNGTLITYRADGSICYTAKPKIISGSDWVQQYTDGLGQEVASHRRVDAGNQVEVTCDGTATIGTLPFDCSTALGQAGKCLVGQCPR